MDKKEARQAICKVLNTGGFSRISSKGHPEDRKYERRISDQDIFRIISTGSMITEPKEHRLGFECVMRGYIDDNHICEIPVIVDIKNNLIRVKTCIRKTIK